MIIGVPREIKPGEQRVALTPAGVRALVEARHQVVVERGAGLGSSIRDEEYARERATLAGVDEVWARAMGPKAIAAPVLIIMMLAMMILPLPAFVLDIFFSSVQVGLNDYSNIVEFRSQSSKYFQRSFRLR